MSYRGDFYLGSNIDFKFTSIDAGIPTSVSGSFVAVYGSNSVSEITAGITFTPDFDSRVGLNHVRVAATVGNGFAAATDYDVIMISGTVGGKSIAGYTLGSFSLQNRYNDITGTYPFSNLVNLDVAVSSRLSSGTFAGNYIVPPTANENADALLKRDWNSVTGEAARSVLNALRKLRNKVSFSAGTLTTTKEDDSTPAYTQSVTTDDTQEPFKEVG